MSGRMIPVLLLGICFLLAACNNAPQTLHGAWHGEGKFGAAQGSMDVRAQVEILPDGTYRFMVLEPAILALAGVERGTWTQSGDLVHLTPNEEKPGEQRSVLFGSAPRNFRPKTLAIEENLKSLSLDDGPLKVTFKHNPKATEQMREAGEL